MHDRGVAASIDASPTVSNGTSTGAPACRPSRARSSRRSAVVLQFLLAIQVSIEILQPRDDVIATIEHLAQTWHDKLPGDRKRRTRRADVLARRDVARLAIRIERDGDRMVSPP
jgi:hypothetical protein